MAGEQIGKVQYLGKAKTDIYQTKVLEHTNFLRKMTMGNKQVGVKGRIMHAALDSGFLYETLF